jgi:16S rRNA (guanine966-N2)-methyltransferase
MRIVAGSLKGRRIEAPAGRDTRPTADRVRQALFDILVHSPLVELEGARVVDAFAGSGALGLEALSRGAAHCTFLEKDFKAAACIQANIKALGVEGETALLRLDATRPPAAPASCTLVFLDPPYRKGLVSPCLEALAARGWLADGALAVVEVGDDETVVPPPGFETADERGRGAAKLVFLVYRRP